jgi:hypothetical protein
MSTNLREKILASTGVAAVPVPCPEWGDGVVVWIHPLTGDQRDALEEESTEIAALENFAPGSGKRRLHARAVVRAARDGEGKPVFTLADVEALAQRSARALDRCYRVLDRLSAVSDEEVVGLLGKSAETPGGGSSTASAASSG